jgi:tetratricopeptide (TPR) repeat protein
LGAPAAAEKSRASRLVSALVVSLPLAAADAVYFLLRKNALGTLVASTQHLSTRTLILSLPGTIWFYSKALLWPVVSRAVGNSVPVEKFSVSEVLLPALGVLVCLSAAGIAIVWGWRKAIRDFPADAATNIHRSLTIATLMLSLPVLLALNLNTLVPGDFLHGRYVYLPSAGLSLLLATVWRMLDRNQMPWLAAAGGLAVAFIVLTVLQEPMWKDDLAFYSKAHEIAPRNEPVHLALSRAHVQYAMRLDAQGRCEEAVPMLEEASREFPQDWFAWAGLGECYYKLNDMTRAEQSLARASELSHNPRVTEQWQMLREHMGLTSAPALKN